MKGSQQHSKLSAAESTKTENTPVKASEVEDDVTDVGMEQESARKRNEKSSESWAKTDPGETPQKK